MVIKLTQKELALLCGCTQATISKALHGDPSIRKELREKIVSAAAAHEISNEYTRGDHRSIVLVVTPEYKSELYANALSYLSKSLWQYDLNVLSTTYEFDGRKRSRLLHIVRSIHYLCGIIDFSSVINDDWNTVIRSGIPVVLNMKSDQSDCVYSMLYGGIREAIMYLVSRGRKRIAFSGEQNTLIKEFCFRQAMAELGLATDNRYIHRSLLRFAQAGADCFDALFSLDEPPDAIICAYDYMAFGLLNSADAARISVPRDLCVIGMDNISATSNYRMGLTTIDINSQLACDTLVELLIRRMRNPDAPFMQIGLPYKLIIRET